MAAGAAYFINFTLKHESGYFDVAAGDKPLLHLWSLAVEEQFYIVWPLLLMLVRRRRMLIAVIAALAVASFAGSLVALGKNQASAFYLPHYRVWELGAGALLAAAALGGGPFARLRGSALADIGSIAGLALVLGPALFLAQRPDYPGYFALMPTAGALFLIAAGPHALVNRTLLSQPFMVGIGLVSYALYLWHWPILSFAHILGRGDDTIVTLLCVAAAVALACVTYLYVERPLRRARFAALPTALVGATLSLCLLGVLSQHKALPPRLDALRYQRIADAIGDWGFPGALRKAVAPSGLRIDTAGEGRDKVLFLGDSNMQQYWPRIERSLSRSPNFLSVTFATRGGCVPIPEIPAQPECGNFAGRGYDLATDASIKTIVIGAAWVTYFSTTIATPDKRERALVSLAKAVGSLTARGKSVWLILNIPNGPGISPATAVQRTLWGDTTIAPLRLSRAQFERSWAPVKARLIDIARSAGARVIDPADWLCGDTVCPGETGDGDPIYMDGGHLRASYAREHAAFMDQTLGITTGSISR